MYVYRGGQVSGFEVGYYTPSEHFYIESRPTTAGEAAARCNYLNGGTGVPIAN